jgi:hypothetical protein
MGLFSHRDESAPEEEVAAEPPRRHSSLFSKHTHRSVSPVSTTNTTNSTSPHRRSGILHRRDEDPTIIAARERVINAEAMEKEADRALASARLAVREAREHIKRLEKEAAEE